MHKLFFFYSLCILFACRSDSKNEDLERRLDQLEKENRELREKQNSQNRSDNNYPPQISSPEPSTYETPIFSEETATTSVNRQKTKYAYVVIKTKEPKLIHYEGSFVPDGIGSYSGTKTGDVNSIEWENFVYVTDIQEVENYNEDKKYKLMDEAEASVRNKLIFRDNQFQSEVSFKVDDLTEKRHFEDNRSEVTDRECHVFDTYKQASEHRSKNKSTF